MGVKSIRLASMLSFDDKQEADIINLVESLNASHRMGEFMSNLIRLAFDNPEIIEKTPNGQVAFGNLMRVIANYGRTPDRKVFVDAQNKQLLAMQEKVDTIYNMCLQMYTMAEAGKILGFESKVENMLVAEFMLEQQLNKLQQSLGVDCANKAFASNKINNVKENAADNLAYIISCYEPIINALKQDLKVKELEIKVKELEIPIKTVEIESKIEKVEQTVEEKVEQTTVQKSVQPENMMTMGQMMFDPSQMMYNQQLMMMQQMMAQQQQSIAGQQYVMPQMQQAMAMQPVTQQAVPTHVQENMIQKPVIQEEKVIKLDKNEEILKEEDETIEFNYDSLDSMLDFFGDS